MRPRLIFGRQAPADRFNYRVVRAERGAPTRVPDALDQPVQVIDARNLADRIALSVVAGEPSEANAAGRRLHRLSERCGTPAGR